MKSYDLDIKEEDILVKVYRLTANAAQQRGDALRVATEDNKDMLLQFLDSGKRVVEAAMGRYGTGGISYSMPENWEYKEELENRVNGFLADYVMACWIALSAEVETPVVDLMPILNKRKKPI